MFSFIEMYICLCTYLCVVTKLIAVYGRVKDYFLFHICTVSRYI